MLYGSEKVEALHDFQRKSSRNEQEPSNAFFSGLMCICGSPFGPFCISMLVCMGLVPHVCMDLVSHKPWPFLMENCIRHPRFCWKPFDRLSHVCEIV